MAIDATQGPGAAAGTSVSAAIRKAAQVTGAKFEYLLSTAKIESNLNPRAAAPTSSAGGLFQFIDRTWLGTLKEAGPLLGYNRYADAITRTEDGRYLVSDPAMRREIMALRQDPTANALMAGVFTNSNAKHLTNKLGRAPSEGELYIAHFMGASGAARLIGMAESNPNGIAANSFASAARANRSIFFDKNGRARSFAEVASNLRGRYDVARARMPAIESADAASGVVAASFALQSAQASRAYQVPTPAASAPVAAANTGDRVFHNPYRAGERRQPVSSTVADLWTNKGAGELSSRTRQQEAARLAALELAAKTKPQAPAEAPPPVSRSSEPAPFGLFQDSKPDVRSLFTAGVRG